MFDFGHEAEAFPSYVVCITQHKDLGLHSRAQWLYMYWNKFLRVFVWVLNECIDVSVGVCVSEALMSPRPDIHIYTTVTIKTWIWAKKKENVFKRIGSTMETSLVMLTSAHINNFGNCGQRRHHSQKRLLYKCYDSPVISHIFLIPQKVLNILSLEKTNCFDKVPTLTRFDLTHIQSLTFLSSLCFCIYYVCSCATFIFLGTLLFLVLYIYLWVVLLLI